MIGTDFQPAARMNPVTLRFAGDLEHDFIEDYYEKSLKLLRQGGLIAIDNVLWGGDVADPAINDENTTVLRELNAKLQHDERVTISMLPIGDGLTLARKR